MAARQAERRAAADPRVIDAVQQAETATADRDEMRQRHEQERQALLVSEYGAEQARRAHLGMRVVSPSRAARDAKTQTAMLRAEADELRSLPVNEAVHRIEAKRAEQGHQRRQAAEHGRQISEAFGHDAHRSDPRRDRPTRGL